MTTPDEIGSHELSQQHEHFRISLYYCYAAIEDVDEHVSFEQALCKELNLRGRIRVSSEGLNGVLSGLYSSLQQYQQRLEERVSRKIDIKYCLMRHDLSVESQLFDSLSVKSTREVVSLYEPTAQEMQRQSAVKQGDRKYYRRRRRDRQKHEQQQTKSEQQPSDVPVSPSDDRLALLDPSPHLTPREWNERLATDKNAIIVDARNCYESRVGYFQAEGIPTLLTNTRKYSSLPQVLQQSKEALAGKTVYMYCTGGVRCERASVFLQALEWEEPPKKIYQLDGGIQRYLEQYGAVEADEANADCLFRGKNFVFDPRRTDPVVGKDTVGSCLLCDIHHDDYDNGTAPCNNTEARCCKCRVLLLVCSTCRFKVRVWGQKGDENPALYCGLYKCVDEGSLAEQACLLK